jgi:hypothetical protein
MGWPGDCRAYSGPQICLVDEVAVGWDETEQEGTWEPSRDTKIDEAKDRILTVMGAEDKRVFFIKQLQVMLEGEFYHWIVGRAVGELVEEKRIGHENVRLRHGKASFLYSRRHRYPRRQIRKAAELIERYSQEEVARGCGAWAENLFLVSLMQHGFRFASQEIEEQRGTRAFAGKEWTQTKHNLDFIVARDDVVYGAEVKNTWDYIPPEEMRVKLAICGYLGITPLFIWRFAPKSYMWEIIQAGGYGMIFKTHIFPPTHERLGREVRDMLGLSVTGLGVSQTG